MVSDLNFNLCWNRLGSWCWGFALAVAICPGLGAYATWPRWGILLMGIGLFRPKPGQIDLTCLILLGLGLVLAAVSLLWTPDLMTGLGDLLQLAALAAVLILAASWRDCEMALLGLAWGLAMSAGLIGLELAGFNLIVHETSTAGLFGNREWLAELLAPMVVWLLASKRLGLGFVLALALLATGSRIGLLTVVLGLGWWIAAGRAWMLILLAYLAVGLGLTLLETGNGLVSIAGRANGWLLAIQLWQPLGLGLGFFHGAWPFQQVVHSDLLQLASELGLGVAPLLLLSLVLVWRNWRNGLIWSPAGAAFVAICFEACVSFPLHTPVGGWLAAVLAGSLASKRSVVADSGAGFGNDYEKCPVEWGLADSAPSRG